MATTTTSMLRREGLYLASRLTWNMVEVVVAERLTKNYEEFRAVDGINFSIHQGECFGFLGPNGAGKSTTMRMIHCASPLTSGQAQGPRPGRHRRAKADQGPHRRRPSGEQPRPGFPRYQEPHRLCPLLQNGQGHGPETRRGAVEVHAADREAG